MGRLKDNIFKIEPPAKTKKPVVYKILLFTTSFNLPNNIKNELKIKIYPVTTHCTAFISALKSLAISYKATFMVFESSMAKNPPVALTRNMSHLTFCVFVSCIMPFRIINYYNINTKNITVYHIGDKPNNINSKITNFIGGFLTDEERDSAMTNASVKDIAFVRDNTKWSGTAQNILRRFLLKK